MIACTLDYKWHYYVIAALISLFGGVVILLPIRFACQVLERRRRRRRPTTVTSLQYTLYCHMQSKAEGILAGNSTVNKIIVSSVYHHHYHYNLFQVNSVWSSLYGQLLTLISIGGGHANS